MEFNDLYGFVRPDIVKKRFLTAHLRVFKRSRSPSTYLVESIPKHSTAL